MVKKTLKNLRNIIFVLLVLAVLATVVAFRVGKFPSLGERFITLARVDNSFVETTARFTTLPPGATLPSETTCASRIHRSAWEPRPDNYIANHRVPTVQQIAAMAPWGPKKGLDPKADTFRKQITGNFTGTTDEIIQWVACKWGIDDDIIRAEAVAESTWHQNYNGDWTTNRSLCPPGAWNGAGCFQSHGILQIKYIDDTTTWPMSRDDTAFSAEYAYGLIRSCYEGGTSYLHNRMPVSGYPRYYAGDLWGCIGVWYSGSWYDNDAIKYINTVKTDLVNKEWQKPWF